MPSLRRPALIIGLICSLSACATMCAPTPGPPPAPGEIPLTQVHLTTEGGAPVLTTEDYVNATVRVVGQAGEEQLIASTEIRGRGNSTWTLPKRPYRLRLGEAASLAGMPADRDWNLLANHLDRSLVRNRFAQDLGVRLGVPHGPRSVFVELWLNGSYEGLYELYEHVEVAPDRIAVDELDPDVFATSEQVTGGYHIEIDHRLDEDVCWGTSRNVPVCSKSPEFDPAAIADPSHPSAAMYDYITAYVNRAEASIHTPGESYRDYFDVPSMVNWFLVTEIMKVNDGAISPSGVGSTGFTSSVFLTKPRGGKLVFGPLWDYDIGAGNSGFGAVDDPTGWWIRSSDWFQPLFQHSSFGREVFATWCRLRSEGAIAGFPGHIEAIVAGIQPTAIERNFARWPVLEAPWPQYFAAPTHRGHVDHLSSWVTTRTDWMHGELEREFGACPVG